MWPRRVKTLFAFATLFLFGCASLAVQAQRSDASQGAQRFMEYCAGCHGADARGGDKAPPLVSASNSTHLSNSELFRIVHDGTTGGMPPFAQIGDANIRAVVEFLTRLRDNTSAIDTSADAAVTGDVDAGGALYFGKAQCSTCHLMQGKGGFMARNLTAYGRTRTADEILRAITTPDTPLVPSSQVVTVTTKAGQKLTRGIAKRGQFQPGSTDRRRPLSSSGAERRD